MSHKNTYSELVPLFGVAILVVLITQTLDELTPSIVSLIAIAYIASNAIVSTLLGILTLKRFAEHTLIAAIIWTVLVSII